jgi:hypothetical protein
MPNSSSAHKSNSINFSCSTNKSSRFKDVRQILMIFATALLPLLAGAFSLLMSAILSVWNVTVYGAEQSLTNFKNIFKL